MKMTKKLTLTALCLVVLCAGFTVFQLMRHQNHTRMTGADLTEPASDLYSGENDEQFYDTDSIPAIPNMKHANEYGFIMRKPKDRDDITGFAYEPWHFRYIGPETAGMIHEQERWSALEEYCRIEGGLYVN